MYYIDIIKALKNRDEELDLKQIAECMLKLNPDRHINTHRLSRVLCNMYKSNVLGRRLVKGNKNYKYVYTLVMKFNI